PDASAGSTYDADATRRYETLDLDATEPTDASSPEPDGIEFEVPAAESPLDLPEVPAPAEAATEDTETLDWLAETASDAPAVPDLPDLDFDVDGDADGNADADAVAPSDDLPDEFPPSEDAVGTQLDLARAYLDMGDPAGARRSEER